MDEILKHYPEIKGVHPACLAVPSISDDDYKELLADIDKSGLLHPIVLTKDGELLDGRNRLRACFDAMVEPRFEQTGIDPWNYAYAANIARRHLKPGQKAAFGQAMLEAEKVKGAERRRATQNNKSAEAVQKTFSEQDKGQSRDKVAKAVGVSGPSIDKAAKIKEYTPDVFEDMKQGKIDLEPAYREARKIEQQKKSQPVETPPKEKPKPAPKPETVDVITLDGKVKKLPKPARVVFNRTNDSVDWASWTWNPVTGCHHGCGFCYAREIANSQRMEPYYPFKFEPTFHQYRLEAPKNTKPPQNDIPRDGRVFVCSMADLFGKWVPKDWIQQVFEACLQSPEWEYLFLTKWPAKYAQMPLVATAWYGASVVTQADVSRVEKAMQDFEAPDAIKWISMEPMLGPIRFNDLSWCDLVVIGSQTSTHQPDGFSPAVPAKFDEVVDVVNQCREWGVPYYLKANMGLDQPGMELPKMAPKTR